MRYFKIFSSFVFIIPFFAFLFAIKPVSAASVCSSKPSVRVTIVTDCQKVNVTAYEGYCKQTLGTKEVTCYQYTDGCSTASYNVGGCSSWATGCVLQPSTHDNITSCAGVTEPPAVTRVVTVGPATSTPAQTATPVQTATPTPVPSYCQNIKAYSASWSELTYTQLTQTVAGQKLYYCVNGMASTGTFDKARFTINGTLQPETTLQRPGSTDFCYLYTVPNAVYNFNIVGEIHNTVSGWVY